MAVFLCPYCYEYHNILKCDIKCSYNIKGKLDVTCINNITKNKFGYMDQKNKPNCLKCTKAKKTIICPTTNREVPRQFLDKSSSLPISLVGAKASGKSNYIAVLINQIRKKMCGPFECSLNLLANQESKDAYDSIYYKPLFEKGYVVQGTTASEEIPPLIFPLEFKNKTATLTFYDTAGENFDSDDSVLIFNKYIPNSKGIILLLDPLQVPSVRKKLEGKMALPEVNTDVIEVLNRIVNNIRDVKNVKGIIPIPLAVVFTKIDALEKFDIIPQDSWIRQESEHLRRGKFVDIDFRGTNNEIKELLENWLDEELLQKMKMFKPYALFAISALGDIPNGNRISGDEIHPKRVLDPLLWLLAENKFIKIVKD